MNNKQDDIDSEDKSIFSDETRHKPDFEMTPGSSLDDVLKSIESEDYGEALIRTFDTPPGEEGRQLLNQSRIVSQATIRALNNLNITDEEAVRILGQPISTKNQLIPGTDAYNSALQFIKIYESLFGIFAGDLKVMADWMRNDNTALDSPPILLLYKKSGIDEVTNYLKSFNSNL